MKKLLILAVIIIAIVLIVIYLFFPSFLINNSFTNEDTSAAIKTIKTYKPNEGKNIVYGNMNLTINDASNDEITFTAKIIRKEGLHSVINMINETKTEVVPDPKI